MRELDDARYKAIGARIRDVRLQRNMSQASDVYKRQYE